MSKIFISHSSKDKKIVDLFIEKILTLGLGISSNNIFCTSLEGSNVRSGDDFINSIKQQLTEASAVILIITENYKNSEICLNEMGAAWILEKRTTPFVLDVGFDRLGFLHIRTQALVLSSDDDLHKFLDDHDDLIEGRVRSANFNRQVKSFLTALEDTRFPENVEYYLESYGWNKEKFHFCNNCKSMKNHYLYSKHTDSIPDRTKICSECLSLYRNGSCDSKEDENSDMGAKLMS